MTRFLCFLLFLLPVFGSVSAQQIDSLLEIQRKADPQEKIYVQFDKNYYNPGETIWFKAYLFSGIEPSVQSKNFYAELLDENGHVLNQFAGPINFSGAAGSFDLDTAFTNPAVYFRAYTTAMLNSDTSFFFTKAIRVLTNTASVAKKVTPTLPPTLALLPEGGDLVTGLPATVAFAATNAQGLPVVVNGSVVDNTGTKVAELVTLHDGMGRFDLTPLEGKTYTAQWKTNDGKAYSTVLPIAKTQGVNLKLTDREGGKRFLLNRSQQAADNLKRLHVIGFMNQRLVFKADVDMTAKEAAAGLFPTKELPSGILQITVFDSGYKPVAERITFVNNHDYEFDGDVFLSQKNLTRRGLNRLEIIMTDTLPANLSLSVTDADLNESNRMEDNIISRLLLTGELRGKLIDPYYYFYSNNDSAAVYLDLVMLTHGWRRYNWDKVMAGKVAMPKWKESNYLSLSGQVAGMQPGSYSPDLQLVGFLQTADSAKSFISLPVDRKGNVFADGLIFYDKAKLFFNFNKKSLSFDKSMLLLDNGLYKSFKRALLDSLIRLNLQDVSAATLASNQANSKLAQQAIRQLARTSMLENITVKARAKTAKDKMEEKYVSGLFSGDARSFDLVNDAMAGGYIDIFQYLQGKVAGLQINGSGSGTSLSWRGGTPVLYLNEMQTDINMISSTPVSDIAYIKIFRPGESIVSGSGGGVIAIYTRKGGDAAPSADAKGLSAVQMTGYSALKEFYSPDYATPSERDALDDVRSTLYWNPAIYLDKNRRHLRLQFYNNDVTKRFRLVMEGLNTEGKLIHLEKTISQ